MPDLTIQQYPVQPALGRHLVLDPRSLAYRRPYTGDPIHPTEWAPKVPVLDQQNLLAQGIRTSTLAEGVDDVDALGSCTANAAAAAVSVLHTADQLATAGLDVTDPAAAETWAIGLYSDATHRDEWLDDTWPSTDSGSSGLGVAKALRERGLIDQYGHATTAEELCMLLQTGPVLMGMPWYDAFFSPVGRQALLDDIPDWQSSPVAGGHEVCITALEHVMFLPDGGLDYPRTILRARNSWSTSWGDAGEFRLSLALYQALRSEIDLVQPRLDSSR
ncbi:hypothetical protein B0E38_02600 [Streptomyces sp. 111WW2]|uniref:hypothetical protein n=1 Tax=Streptomyces sp. 111WW2 TaxID=1945515 RepID=UPI000D0C8176|nr:hypothetical protein [Streptomyces sp. 111WW2]PSK57069.1 hypothetical protein B0E38_02600 [Streptomyces sp. 111WW2]